MMNGSADQFPLPPGDTGPPPQDEPVGADYGATEAGARDTAPSTVPSAPRLPPHPSPVQLAAGIDTIVQQAAHRDAAAIAGIDQRLRTLGNVDLRALQAQNPQLAQTTAQEILRLREARGAVIAAAQQRHGKHAQLRGRLAEAQGGQGNAGHTALGRLVPGWNAEKAEMARAYARTRGFTDAELRQVRDPRMVATLYQAALAARADRSGEPGPGNRPPAPAQGPLSRVGQRASGHSSLPSDRMAISDWMNRRHEQVRQSRSRRYP